MPIECWEVEEGVRVEGSLPLDSGKVQAPFAISLPNGRVRLLYTAVGPTRPFRHCQGYILSALSTNGVDFTKEDGIRVAPCEDNARMSLRVLSPTVVSCEDGWRMYFEARGVPGSPSTICSAISNDAFHWNIEKGCCLQSENALGGPRATLLFDGRIRLYCFSSSLPDESSGQKKQGIVSAVSDDGIHFIQEAGYRLRALEQPQESADITAAQVLIPERKGDTWKMYYSAWEDVPPGTVVPKHPSHANEGDAVLDEDFASASIATDMAGYRSRIFLAESTDGLSWERCGCLIDGGGYESAALHAVHAEDLSMIPTVGEGLRMYFAGCDRHGVWRVLSAVKSNDSTTAPPSHAPKPKEFFIRNT